MELTAEQKQAVTGWVEEGSGLAEIQRRLDSEFGISLTYMDLRFLVLDLGLAVHDKPDPTPAAPETGDTAPPAAPTDLGGGVSVEISRLTQPGALVSGTVTFSDGNTAAWSLDQFGRLGLNPTQSGYKPSPEDLRQFQEELKNQIEKRGF